MLHYMGDDTTAVQFPHWNRKKLQSHYRTYPSVVKRLCKTNDSLSNVYEHEISAKFPSHLQPVCLPRNVKQIQNAQAQERQKFCSSHDALYNLHEVAYDLTDFVHKIETYPNLLVICGLNHLTDQLNRFI